MDQATETNTTTLTLTKKAERALALNAQLRARELAIAEKASLRKSAAEEVERLLDFLDRLDDDPDLEDGGDDEPGHDNEFSMGWTDREARNGSHVFQSDDEIEESDHETEGDGNCDNEPSLGSYHCGQVDLEADDSDLEADHEEGHDRVERDPAYEARLAARRPAKRRPSWSNVTLVGLQGGATMIVSPDGTVLTSINPADFAPPPVTGGRP